MFWVKSLPPAATVIDRSKRRCDVAAKITYSEVLSSVGFRIASPMRGACVHTACPSFAEATAETPMVLDSCRLVLQTDSQQKSFAFVARW